MKRFISRKVIKVPRYRLLYILTFLSTILIIVLNILLTIVLNKIDSDKFINIMIGNSYGNIINPYNTYHDKKNYFYQNAFGFSIYNNKPVFEVKQNIKEPIIDSSPIIYIYNTFQTDKYVNPYYSSYSINPVVTQGSLILQENLKNLGINTLVETKSVAKVLKENNIDYSLSYRGSRILLESVFKENPSLKYFFDLGIADDKRASTTFNSNDSSYARILFVVGTDNQSYDSNQKLAISLNELLDKEFKGLSRGVSLRGGTGYHGVYNQDFSPNCLLIYIGGKENTIDEVNRSLKVLAKVINNYLKEDKHESN